MNFKRSLGIFISIILLGTQILFVFGSEGEKDLLDKLLKEYNILERPIRNSSETLLVSFRMSLEALIVLDVTYQYMDFYLWKKLTWHDWNLRWDPKRHHIFDISIPTHRIWNPEIIMVNSLHPYFDGTQNTNAIVRSNGSVTYAAIGVYRFPCTPNVEYFPFDEHKCTMKFRSWTNGAEKIDFAYSSDTASEMETFKRNQFWEIIKTSASVSRHYNSDAAYPWAELSFDIYVRSRGSDNLFTHGSLLTFGILILLFNTGLPLNSGHRLVLGITTMLSGSYNCHRVITYLGGVVSKLVFYYQTLIFLAFVSIVSNILVIYLSDREGRVPNCVKKLFCLKVTELRSETDEVPDAKISKTYKSDNSEIEEGTMMQTESSPSRDNFISELRAMINQSRLKACDQKSMKNEWKALAQVVNRIAFVFFLVAAIVFQIGFHCTFCQFYF